MGKTAHGCGSCACSACSSRASSSQAASISAFFCSAPRHCVSYLQGLQPGLHQQHLLRYQSSPGQHTPYATNYCSPICSPSMHNAILASLKAGTTLVLKVQQAFYYALPPSVIAFGSR